MKNANQKARGAFALIGNTIGGAAFMIGLAILVIIIGSLLERAS